MADPAVLRIIDANFNRAREALRVAEDYARFALDASHLTEELKRLRHRLRAAVEALGPSAAEMLAARDTAGDVGTPLATEAELQRADAASVAQAAFKRLPEALRCLEEYGKTLDAEAARGIEDLRYRGYELELQMFRLPRKRLEEAVLYLILDRAEATQEELLDLARGALEGGADMVQLRQKEAEGRELLDLAEALREMTREHDALLIINDRADIARLADADGAHLGQHDLPLRAGRRLLGPDKIIGATANSVEDAEAAEAAGADYVGCGAMYSSITKPNRKVVGPQRWAEVQKAVRIPVFAIGGVDLTHLDELRAAGVDRVAVSHAIVAAEDASAAARAFRQELAEGADA
jgi:thiamine-phosphate pyrophosphorylase